jgi:NAD(P)-dependent dehydrogenase (short-subunit alcohol dehydrogenase family)
VSKFGNAPVCLVTGGSSGIGLAIAERFAKQGYRLAICGRRVVELNRAANRIRQLQRDLSAGEPSSDSEICLAEVVDLTETHQATSFAELVFQRMGQVDVLVNNAAAAPLAAFETVSETEFEQTLNINIRSVFYLTQAVWRKWISQSSSVKLTHNAKTIINISSLAAIDPFPHFSIYGASKAWLDLMTLALASEGEPHDIRICSIRPGAVETPLLRGLFPEYPADQCASPEDVAQLAFNCVFEPESYPSGQAFRLPDTSSNLGTQVDTPK